MALKVELKPHTCTKQTVLGPIEQEFDQQLVIVNDTHVGYVGNHAGAHINFITRLPRSVTSEIAKEVGRLKSEEVTPKVSEPPTDEEVRAVLKELENQDGDDD